MSENILSSSIFVDKLDLTTNSIIAMQWGFIINSAEVVYQFNPDGTVTEVTE